MSIIIFEKNKIDLQVDDVTIIATDSLAEDAGQEFVDYLRNRRNDSGWATTGSADANNTRLEIQMPDAFEISDIILVGHNFGSYTIERHDGTNWVNFPTPISVSGNTKITTHHAFTAFDLSRFRITITGTQVANSDKFLRQLIVTNRIGTFTAQPFVRKPRLMKGRKVRQMLSGRSNVTRSLGAFSCTLVFPPTKTQGDLDLIERMHNAVEGFLVWLTGTDSPSYPVSVPGFRPEDITLMQCANDYEPEWKDGRWQHGQQPEVDLVESRT